MDDLERNDNQASTPDAAAGDGEPRTPIAEQIIRIYTTDPVVEFTMRIFSKSAEQVLRTVMSEHVTAADAPEARPAEADVEPPEEVPAMELPETGLGAEAAEPIEQDVTQPEDVASASLPNGQESGRTSLESAMTGWLDLVARFQQTRQEEDVEVAAEESVAPAAESTPAPESAAPLEQVQAEPELSTAPGPREAGAEPAESLIARVAGGLLHRHERDESTE